MESKKKPKPIEVGVIAKLLRILTAVQSSRDPSGATLKEISRSAGVNKSTAYRILTHLTRERYLVRTEMGAYRVGPALARYGAQAIATQLGAALEPLPSPETES